MPFRGFILAPQIAENLVLDGLLSQKFGAYNSGSGVDSSFRCPGTHMEAGSS